MLLFTQRVAVTTSGEKDDKMRYSQNCIKIIRNDGGGPILGLCLGFTFVSEHERGIGFEGRDLELRGLRFYEFQKTVCLIYMPTHFIPDFIEPNPVELQEKDIWLIMGHPSMRSGVACAWDSDGFSILAEKTNSELVAFLNEFYRASVSGRACVQLKELQGASLPCIYIEPIEGGLTQSKTYLNDR